MSYETNPRRATVKEEFPKLAQKRCGLLTS